MHTVHHKKHLLTRVRRIAGQTQALEKALESGSDCNDILQQIAAIRGAVSGLMTEVIEGHIREHLANDEITPEKTVERRGTSHQNPQVLILNEHIAASSGCFIRDNFAVV